MPFAATSVVWPGTIAPVPASAAGTVPSTGVTAASADASVDAAAEAVAASAPPAGAVDAELDVGFPVAEDEDELDGVDELVGAEAFVVVELFADELFVDWLLLVVLADFCVVPDELLVVCVRVVGLLVVVVGAAVDVWFVAVEVLFVGAVVVPPPPPEAVGVDVAWFVTVGVAVGVGFFWSSTQA